MVSGSPDRLLCRIHCKHWWRITVNTLKWGPPAHVHSSHPPVLEPEIHTSNDLIIPFPILPCEQILWGGVYIFYPNLRPLLMLCCLSTSPMRCPALSSPRTRIRSTLQGSIQMPTSYPNLFPMQRRVSFSLCFLLAFFVIDRLYLLAFFSLSS